MSERTRTILLAIAMLTIPTGLLAADDPIMGTWKVNTAKTKLRPGQSAEALTRTHEPIPDGIQITRPLVDADGKPTRGTWTLKFDGKDYPVHGDSNLDTLSLKRLDLYTMEAVAKKGGKITNRMRWDVSQDGKTLTWTSKRVLPPERAGTTVRVYDKQ
ncbi:MAG: hypothetical protein ACE10C_03985 [Candidatus Binatia bacterium]